MSALSSRHLWLPLTLVAVLCVQSGPGWVSPANQDTFFTVFTLIALAQGWNLIGGLGGQFSLGHAAFVGAGGYATGVVLLHTGLTWWPALLAAGLVSALFAAIVAFPLFRLRGAYFTIGSLAVALAAQVWMVNWSFTGATRGINLPVGGVPVPEDLFRVAGYVAIGATLLIVWARRSQFGLRLMAVRDSEDAAVGLGVHGFSVKLGAFVLSAFVCGVVGGLIASNQISMEPLAFFGLGFTTDMIIMTIIGGIGTASGPVLGVVVVYFLIERQLESQPSISALLTGVLLVLIIRFAPGGLVGVLRRLGGAVLARRPRRRATTTSAAV